MGLPVRQTLWTSHSCRPKIRRRSASDSSGSADCGCLSRGKLLLLEKPFQVWSSASGPLGTLAWVSFSFRLWTEARAELLAARQEGNCAREESDLGKEAGLELNSTLLPHSHHAFPQGSPPGPLGPFACWRCGLQRPSSGSVLSSEDLISVTWHRGQGSSSFYHLQAPRTITSMWRWRGPRRRPHFASPLASEDPQFLAPSLCSSHTVSSFWGGLE